uniref:Putative zinc finger an1 type protein rhodnius neglectus n=1 Tax=Rhodnius prolixus TaxID=13249 RepID=A0A4P6D7F7_RHOPR
MEFPELGKHCSFNICNRLDFLPLKCDACQNIFCYEHIRYETHKCAAGCLKDVQVPVCPLCNKPVSSSRGQRPDIAVGHHIDNDCQSDPAVGCRQVFKHRCALKGCKKKEVVPIKCNDCNFNYCVTHRHSTDHNCAGINKSSQSQTATKRLPVTTVSTLRPCQVSDIQGSMDEDEALAHAIALSLADADDQLGAARPQLSSHSQQANATQSPTRSTNASCNLS